MGFLSFFTFCVRLRCVLFFSCTIKVPFLIKIVYQNGTSRLIIYNNPPLVKPFFKFFRHLCTEKVKSPTLQVHCVTPQSKQQPPYMYTSLPSEVNNLPRYIYTCKFSPQKVHIWRFRVLKRGKLKLSGGFANKNINNHRQFPSNSV